MSCKKFGKIFVLDSCADNKISQDKNIHSWKQIKSGTFSNSDLVWYGFDGEEHPDFAKYKSFPFSLVFKFNVVCKNLYDFEGKLVTGLFVGDDKSLTTNKTENTQLFKLANSTVRKIIEEYHLGIFCNFITGGSSLEIYPLLQYVLPSVLPREAGQKDAELLKKLDLSYNQLTKVSRYVTGPLRELSQADCDENSLDEKSGNFNLMTLVSPTKLFGFRMVDINSLF